MYLIDSVELEITDRCAHRCPYCYINYHQSNVSYYSDTKVIKRIIDKLAEYSVRMIALLGGDPVLHPDIIEIIKYIKTTSSMTVSIMSNTMDFKGYSVEYMSQLIDNIDFTLHGRNAEEHEAFCGAKPGLYNDVTKVLREYIQRGVNVNIAINLIPDTFDKIYEMVESMFKQGVRFTTLLLQRIIPVGKAQGSGDYDISRKQISETMKQIERVQSEFGIEISFEDPFPLCCVEEKYHKYFKGCPEGINRLPVKGDGRITVCGAIEDCGIGNILTDTYEEIWGNNKKFNEFRSASFLSNKKCFNCIYKMKCRGGCPIRYIMSEKQDGSFEKKFEDD